MSNPEWILGRVVQYLSNIGAYEVVDEDDNRTLRLPETQIIGLDAANLEIIRKLNKNDEVLAVYPDTSTFYSAVMNHAPKRSAGGISAFEGTVLVQFHGDECNELGKINIEKI